MKRICIYLAALLLTLPALADEKALADSAYAHEDFTKAAQIYTQLLDSCGSSAQLYYNLGNCYYRQDSIARAILCYERARLLDPADDDVRMNLEMARAKTVDRVMPSSSPLWRERRLASRWQSSRCLSASLRTSPPISNSINWRTARVQLSCLPPWSSRARPAKPAQTSLYYMRARAWKSTTTP